MKLLLPLRRLLKRTDASEWADDYDEFEGWVAFRNMQNAAARQIWWKRVWLTAVVIAVPVSLLSVLNSFSAKTDARAAVSIAESAQTTAESVQPQPDPDYRAEAVAAVQSRLGRAGHPFQGALIVPDPEFLITDVGEDHLIAVIHNGLIVLEARSVVSQSGTVGVTFIPPSRYEGESVRLSDFYSPGQDVRDALAAAFGLPTQPGGAAAKNEDGTLTDEAFIGLALEGVTLGDFYPEERASLDASVLNQRLGEWLLAWSANDQATLRELGNYTTTDPLPWSRFADYKYQPGSLSVMSTIQFDDYYYPHIRFALRDNSGAILFQDLEMEVFKEGAILRIIKGTPLGEAS